MNALQIGALLMVFGGAFGAVNYIVFRLPSAIGILIVAFVASLFVLGLDALRPGLGVAMEMRRFVADGEFSRTLLEGMLGLLLFAGALHVRIKDVREQAYTIAVMATLGVALSVTVGGFGFHWVTGIRLLTALVFGALNRRPACRHDGIAPLVGRGGPGSLPASPPLPVRTAPCLGLSFAVPAVTQPPHVNPTTPTETAPISAP